MATDLIEQVERNIKRKTSPMSTTTEEDDIVEGFSLPKKAKVVPITGEMKEAMGKLEDLEARLIALVTQSGSQEDQSSVLKQIKAMVEKSEGMTLADKRNRHLTQIQSVQGVKTLEDNIRKESGFDECKELLGALDALNMNMKLAGDSKAEKEKIVAEMRRVATRLRQVQEGMSRVMLKVNLPRNEAAFGSGNGEGCFVVVEEETKQKFDVDRAGGVFLGVLLNSPLYKEWFHLQEGDPVLFTMKGQLRPVAYPNQAIALQDVTALSN